MELTSKKFVTVLCSVTLAFPLLGRTDNGTPPSVQEQRAKPSQNPAPSTELRLSYAEDVEVAVMQDRAKHPILRLDSASAKKLATQIPRADAVSILSAFLTVKVARTRLISSLEKYTGALDGGGVLTKVESNLAVVDAGKNLHIALDNLYSRVTAYSLVNHDEVEATQSYIDHRNGPLVQKIEVEKGVWLSITKGEAKYYLQALQDNTASFESAYQAFGNSIISVYGADVLSDAYRDSIKAGWLN
jgi:hypothetical protein